MLKVVILNHAINFGLRFAVSFQRTLRIPDDGTTYPLPPGLGVFPISNVKDYKEFLPQESKQACSAFIAMYQREAMWLGFKGASWKPNAVKVSIGGINAISGLANDNSLHDSPQDYMVVPNQPWLDGINTGHGLVRQFIAMPLGLGYSVEASLTDQEKYGGIQISVFEPKEGRFPDSPPPDLSVKPQKMSTARSSSGYKQFMGLGAGGVMKQKIYPDHYGIDVWDQENYGAITVHIINSAKYNDITGRELPPTPIDAATYTKYKLPWFDLYDEEKDDIVPSPRLTVAKTITERDLECGIKEKQTTFEVPKTQIKKLSND